MAALTQCASCETAGEDFEQCARCKSVRYCSEACQRSHWRRGHRLECKPFDATPQCEVDLSRAPVCVLRSNLLGDCPICYEPLVANADKMTITACCGNRFCVPCAKRVVKCPLCRHSTPSKAEQVALVRQGVESGRAYAQCLLGGWCFSGDMALHGVPQSFADAAKWLQKAVDQGYADALVRLGYLYSEGRGVPKSMEQTVKLFWQAAVLGFPDAQHNLGVCFAFGNGGVRQSHVEAAKMYKYAVAQDYADAQFNLGAAYEFGEGVRKSPVKALKLYKKAAAQGHGQCPPPNDYGQHPGQFLPPNDYGQHPGQ